MKDANQKKTTAKIASAFLGLLGIVASLINFYLNNTQYIKLAGVLIFIFGTSTFFLIVIIENRFIKNEELTLNNREDEKTISEQKAEQAASIAKRIQDLAKLQFAKEEEKENKRPFYFKKESFEKGLYISATELKLNRDEPHILGNVPSIRAELDIFTKEASYFILDVCCIRFQLSGDEYWGSGNIKGLDGKCIGVYYINENKHRYEGEFFDNKRHGYGIEYDNTGVIVRSGYWEKNEYKGR